MEIIDSLENLEAYIKNARDLVVVLFQNPHEVNSERLYSMFHGLKDMYPSISMVKVNKVLVDAYSKYGISSLPTVAFMKVDAYSRSIVEALAKLRGSDITKENIITCILNCSSDLELK